MGPVGIAVNPAHNKIYVTNPPNITVIDGTTNAKTNVAGDSYAGAVSVNTITNKAYVANEGSDTVTVLTPAPTNAIPLNTTITPLQGNTSTSRHSYIYANRNIDLFDRTSASEHLFSDGYGERHMDTCRHYRQHQHDLNGNRDSGSIAAWFTYYLFLCDRWIGWYFNKSETKCTRSQKRQHCAVSLILNRRR